MGFFYKLFNGEICPIENLVRQTPEYTKALHELAAASEKLEKSLTPGRRGAAERAHAIPVRRKAGKNPTEYLCADSTNFLKKRFLICCIG